MMSEDQIDEALMDSFPASDAPPWTLGTLRREEDPPGRDAGSIDPKAGP